ncbi:hypothetical protein AB0H63_25370 [Micromonospora echinospora]|uniref:hypothetical protein n=1 Tax=Micromonospora echinospora TaxID=1877 RepID=UPI003411018E
MHVKNWDKAKLDFGVFRDTVSMAADRARKLGDAPETNPSTAVWRLVEALRGHGCR